MIAELKAGDRARGKYSGDLYEVYAVHGDEAWVHSMNRPNLESYVELCEYLIKEVPRFEVGHLYENTLNDEIWTVVHVFDDGEAVLIRTTSLGHLNSVLRAEAKTIKNFKEVK